MPVGRLYKWVLDSCRETTRNLNEMRGQLERKLIGLVAAGRLEVQEALKAVGAVHSQISGLKKELEDKVVRKFEAALDLLGIPSEREIEELKKRVDRLSKKVKDINEAEKAEPRG